MQIYNKAPTRQVATDWIINNISEGKTISIEHWDDSIPIYGQDKYKMLTLPMYEPDTPEKWVGIENTLSQTDYIIIASNRLYVPLMRLTNCATLPPDRCYLKTADYYKKLFPFHDCVSFPKLDLAYFLLTIYFLTLLKH